MTTTLQLQTPAPVLLRGWRRVVACLICCILAIPADAFAAPRSGKGQESAPALQPAAAPQDTVTYVNAELLVPAIRPDTVTVPGDARFIEDNDTTKTIVIDENSPYGLDGKIPFNPDPTRAVWLSALFPGLGQIYNRRYWKLPIVVGGFMGLAYATSWNNGQYQDYSQAYRDLLDNDPDTKSYMDFFPPTTTEDSLDKTWLTNVMKTRKDYYRRNRDLCIICVVGLYLLCMVDAYVDASLAHFDISDNVALDLAPTLQLAPTPAGARVNLALNWAFTF